LLFGVVVGWRASGLVVEPVVELEVRTEARSHHEQRDTVEGKDKGQTYPKQHVVGTKISGILVVGVIDVYEVN
jgi:hypothetical protein